MKFIPIAISCFMLVFRNSNASKETIYPRCFSKQRCHFHDFETKFNLFIYVSELVFREQPFLEASGNMSSLIK